MFSMIQVGGEDRGTLIQSNLKVNRALTSQVDTCAFEVVRDLSASPADWKPEALDVVEVYEDATLIFGGQITDMSAKISGGDVEVISVNAKDYSFDMDRIIVIATYESKTVKEILDDFRDNWLPAGYNTDNVVCDELVTFISFNYEYPTKCIQQLADLFNFDYYVDGNKNIYLKARTATAAPFSLSDGDENTDGNYFFDTLVIKEDITSLRNRIFVRGGTYSGAPDSESKIADGEATTYTQGYRYSNIVVTVDGVTQTLGIDNLHDPADYDVLYNYSEKALKWRADNKPVINKVIEVSGNPEKPILVRQQDLPSITNYDVFEYKIEDASIQTKQAARDRALAELNEWKEAIDSGSFVTNKAGLNVGQVIHINSVKRGIDDDFVITRISSSLRNAQEFEHNCTLASTKTFGMIEFLQALLMQKDKEIKVDANEILEAFLTLSDILATGDSINSVTTGSSPYYWSPLTVQTNAMNWNFFTWKH